MASIIYEPIMVALLNLLQTNCGTTFNSYNRRFIMWENLASTPLVQPALFLYGGAGLGGGTTKYEQRGRGRPLVRVLSRTIVVYAQLPGAGTPSGQDATTPGDTVFGPLVESIENAFVPDSENAVTLGGLVSHCWIEGDALWATPDIDPQGQGMFTVPVKIMIP
jgi:hypothetical protein